MLPNVPDRELDPPELPELTPAEEADAEAAAESAVEDLAQKMRDAESDREWIETFLDAMDAYLWPSAKALEHEAGRAKAARLRVFRDLVERCGSPAANDSLRETIRAALARHYRSRAEEALS